MTDIPYGVGGCRCTINLSASDWDAPDAWHRNPTCPYHGIVADGFGASRTDTGVYRVVRDADGDSLDNRLRKGIEQARRGETVDRGDFTPDCEACQQYGECLDCEQAREEAEEHSCAHEGCTGEPGPDSVDHRLDEAAERVARISEGLNQRLAGCTCGGGSTDQQRSCPRHGYDGDITADVKRMQVPVTDGTVADTGICLRCGGPRGMNGEPVCPPCFETLKEGLASRVWHERFFEGSASSTKHLASGALRPALTAEEEKYYWLIHKPAWWRRLFRR